MPTGLEPVASAAGVAVVPLRAGRLSSFPSAPAGGGAGGGGGGAGVGGGGGARRPGRGGGAAPPGGLSTFQNMLLNELTDGTEIDQVLLVREAERRQRRDGGDYLRLQLGDRTGAVACMVWEELGEVGSWRAPARRCACAAATPSTPASARRSTCASWSPPAPGSFALEDLLDGPAREVEQMEGEVRELLATIQEPHLRVLLERVFGEDSELWARYRVAPAAKYYHQAYRHGLLEHCLGVAQAVSAISATFPGIDRDVAVTGALLHDIGKLEAYTEDPQRSTSPTPAGCTARSRSATTGSAARSRTSRAFPPELAQAVGHIILSHHGTLEHGSPVVPCTREATLVHMIDNLGGRLGSFDRLEKELAPGAGAGRDSTARSARGAFFAERGGEPAPGRGRPRPAARSGLKSPQIAGCGGTRGHPYRRRLLSLWPMAKDTEKLIRQLSLISYLMAERRPVTALEIRRDVEGYSGMNEDAFARRFYADRSELESLRIQLTVERPADGAAEQENYSLRPENFHLPADRLHRQGAGGAADRAQPARRRIRLRRAAAPGAAADHLGPPQPAAGAPEQRSVALGITASAGGHELSARLAKVETAIFRNKTIVFDYYTMERDEVGARRVDPYHLLFQGGQFYLLGYSHEREAIRVFRLSRIRGKVSYATKAEHDFPPPADFDPRAYANRADWQLGDELGVAADPGLRADRLADRTPLRPLRRDPRRRGGGWRSARLARPPRTGTESPPATPTRAAWSRGCWGWASTRACSGRRSWSRSSAGASSCYASAMTEEPPASRRKRGSQPAERSGRLSARRAARKGGRRCDGEAGQDRGRDPPRALRPPGDAREHPDPGRPKGSRVVMTEICERLQISEEELREDVNVLNVVNFGGGSYVLYAEIKEEEGEIEVDPEPYSDNFDRPARLLPVEAKALVAAIDLIGEHIPEGSLASAREKIVAALGEDPMEQGLQVAPAAGDDSGRRAPGLTRDHRPAADRARVLQGERGRVLPTAGSSPTR